MSALVSNGLTIKITWTKLIRYLVIVDNKLALFVIISFKWVSEVFSLFLFRNNDHRAEPSIFRGAKIVWWEKKNEQPTRLTELDLAWGWCSWADSVCVCISPLVKEQEDGEDLFCTLVRRVDVFMITWVTLANAPILAMLVVSAILRLPEVHHHHHHQCSIYEDEDLSIHTHTSTLFFCILDWLTTNFFFYYKMRSSGGIRTW